MTRDELLKRYFEFVGVDEKRNVENSSKFWEVWLEGNTMRARYGKIGTNGQTTLKEFGSTDDAQKGMAKAVSEKLKKGYVEGSFEATTPSRTTTPPSPGKLPPTNDKVEQISPSSRKPRATKDPANYEAYDVFSLWAAKYQPIFLICLELDELPAGLSEKNVWSQHNNEYGTYLLPGFVAFNENDEWPISNYTVTSVQFDGPVNTDQGIDTEIWSHCPECFGFGIDEDESEECSNCAGLGNIYSVLEYPSALPVLYTLADLTEELRTSGLSQAPLPTAVASNVNGNAKFCTGCGAKREPATSKFCGGCGTAF